MLEKQSRIGSVEELLETVVRYAERQDDIRGVIVMGSQARRERHADKWSDLDLLVITSKPVKYLERVDWIGEIATPILSFIEKQATGEGYERRVLFEDGFDVDFSIEPLTRWVEPGFSDEWLDIVRRGVRVVVNKEGIVKLPVVSPERPTHEPPSQAEFDELTNDFLYHAVWTAKKLRRGELFTAQTCCNGYMKRLLIRMLEIQARSERGWNYDTWYGGRFVEDWADPKSLRGLRTSFAHYDKKGVHRALLETMELFRGIAIETSTRLGLTYPIDKDQKISGIVARTLSELSK